MVQTKPQTEPVISSTVNAPVHAGAVGQSIQSEPEPAEFRELLRHQTELLFISSL